MNYDLAVWGADLDEFVANAVAAERAGFNRAWSSELHRSPFVPLAAVATATTSIGIGTGIALAFVRSPMSLALAALDLDELSHGRLTLGLGSGVKTLIESHHDADFDHPADRLADTVAIVRTLIEQSHAGNRIEHDGEIRSIELRGYQRPYEPARDSIPIHVAAVGPRMTEMAGRNADGWIGHELMSPDYLTSVVLPRISTGAERAGRPDGSVEIVVAANCSIDADRTVAMDRSRASVAFYASVKSYRPFFDFHGFGTEADAVRERFRAGDTAGMINAVPDEMVAAVAIAGTPDEVAHQIDRYDGIADAIKLGPPTYFQDHDSVRTSVEAVIGLNPAMT